MKLPGGGCLRRNWMIDFEEELKRFKPSLEIEEAEDAIVKSDLTDMTEIGRAV